MNVLLTCAGRRRYLVQYFREALAGRGAIYAADCNAEAPAMLEADAAFPVPAVDDPGYRAVLFDVCQRHEVGLLLPLNDLELPALAAWRPLLLAAGTVPVISSPEVINICGDKWQTAQFLAAQGLPGPATYCSLEEAGGALSRGKLTYPLVVKPRWGSASMWVESCAEGEELELAYRLVGRRALRSFGRDGQDEHGCVLIQQGMQGVEYGLDVVNDLAGRHVCTFVRRKLAMRAGETDRAVTVENAQLSELGARLGQALGHVGNLDCDVFLEEGGVQVLEMNPRFGGGYPFSHVAGADLPSALLAWARGEPADPRWFAVTPGIVSAKYDELVVRRLRRVAAEAVTAAGAEERG